MKARYIIALAFVAGMLGAQSDKIIDAARFVVFNDAGNPAVVMTQSGSRGEFVVYDGEGKEVFAVRGGKMAGTAVDAFAARVAPKEPQPAATQPGKVNALSPSGVSLRVKQPDILEGKQVITASLMYSEKVHRFGERKETYVCCVKLTNVSPYAISYDAKPALDGAEVKDIDGGPFYDNDIGGLDVAESTVIVFDVSGVSKDRLKSIVMNMEISSQ